MIKKEFELRIRARANAGLELPTEGFEWKLQRAFSKFQLLDSKFGNSESHVESDVETERDREMDGKNKETSWPRTF